MVYLSHFALLMLADAEKMAELDNLFIAGVKICAEKRNRRAFIRKELDRREANCGTHDKSRWIVNKWVDEWMDDMATIVQTLILV